MPSIMQRVGTPNERHNRDLKYRKHLENVDPELSKFNVAVRERSVEEIYLEYLQPSFDAFNEKQKRRDRRYDVKWNADTALEYQRAIDKAARASSNNIDQKGRPPIREIVWQIGNPEQGYGSRGQTEESREQIKQLLLEVQAEAEKRYPQFAWGSVYFHADETSINGDGEENGSLHLHAAFVPLCYQNKQGPGVQVAFERCLREMGFNTFETWKHDLDSVMETVLERHGLERTYMDNHEKHQKSSEYHRQQKVIQETRELEEKYKQIGQKIDWELDRMEERFEQQVTQSIEAVTNDTAGAYDNVLFLIHECDSERFEELDLEGRELKEEKLQEFSSSQTQASSLDKLINEINSGTYQKITWAERQQLWEKYNAVSDKFWQVRAELKRDYQDELDAAYERRRDAMRSFYDAKYFLRRSRGFIALFGAVVWICIATARESAATKEIQRLRDERQNLLNNTSSFKKFSNAYRDELKTGKMPFGSYLDSMTKVVETLDREAEQFRNQKKPRKVDPRLEAVRKVQEQWKKEDSR